MTPKEFTLKTFGVKESQYEYEFLNVSAKDISTTVEEYIEKHHTKQYAKEMYEKAKEDCGDRVAYKGEISKVEAWSLSTDELQDRCEELCLSTPLPKELQ